MRLLRNVLVFAALSLTAFAAESWNGTLMDVQCKSKDATTHTRQCAIGCAKSGYGLVLPDGKFMKFDAAGDAKALAALKASKKENDLKAKVTGMLHGDMIHVDSVELE